MVSRTLSKFCLPFDEAAPAVHFFKAIKCPRNNAGLASLYYDTDTVLVVFRYLFLQYRHSIGCGTQVVIFTIQAQHWLFSGIYIYNTDTALFVLRYLYLQYRHSIGCTQLSIFTVQTQFWFYSGIIIYINRLVCVCVRVCACVQIFYSS